MSTSADQPIILYHYPGSPNSRRVVWYLALRGIPYIQCIQPRVLPRPDLARLGINYRRIPILSIGRDVYLDSRLILQKLEQLAPERPRLAADGTPEHRVIERLFEAFTMDAGFSRRIVQLMPSDLPMWSDPAFIEDRADLVGGRGLLTAEALAAARPEAINEVKNVFELLETTLLADGREWILGTEGPSLADIEAVWPLHWSTLIPRALPADHISAILFPRVFAWIERFQRAVSAAEKSFSEPQTVSGEQAAALMVTSAYNETEGQVDENDPVVQKQGLQKGQLVQFWPTDTGSGHKDSGRLVRINSKQVTIETVAGDTTVRVHAPRHGFRVVAHSQGGSDL
ncbi:hypothetical protein QBC33DRAFT_515055 [Phialemonium atrogriseum]|uniref:GST N-terminal domain-containing protein n=1 Tax=Phialemonium atrogriseum TaxID=1093897 RepID=A0AAJ0C0Z0_9PEZI|nr:uncharacterized protein QBC33DRAFT_515055 [Phialemonium atrogriseum]KAK1767507.1 hypothetical protein QBC33DRAFT_515055 [Phialemonium atrogriseum]